MTDPSDEPTRSDADDRGPDAARPRRRRRGAADAAAARRARRPGAAPSSRRAASGRRPRRSAAAAAAGRSRPLGGRLAVVAVVIGASAAVVALVTGAAPTATVLGYVPAGQRRVRRGPPRPARRPAPARSASSSRKFPGFADQAALETKLDEVLDQLVDEATSDKQTYTADIKPWFDGELAFSVGPLPGPHGARREPRSAATSRALLLLSVKDAALAQAWFDAAPRRGRRDDARPRPTTARRITVSSEAEGTPETGLRDHRRQGRGRSATSPRSRRPSTPRAPAASPTSPVRRPRSTRSTATTSASCYIALRPLLDWSNDAQQGDGARRSAASRSPASATRCSSARPGLGRRTGCAFEDDAIVIEATAPQAGDGDRPDREPHVDARRARARRRPSSRATSHDLGTTLKRDARPATRREPASSRCSTSSTRRLGLVGGLDASARLDRRHGDRRQRRRRHARGRPDRRQPTDAEDAAKLLTSLRRFVALGGAQQGITVRDEDYNGTTITIVSARRHRQARRVGDGADVRRSPCRAATSRSPTRSPTRSSSSARARLRQARPRHRPPAPRSPTTAATRTLADRVGAEHRRHLRRHRRRSASCIERPDRDARRRARLKTYETDVKPFLVPFDAFVAAGSVDGRPRPVRRHHHRQVADRAPPAPGIEPKRRNRTTHGSPHPADARRREQAADLSRRRRRRPQRPRRARASRRIGHYNPRTEPVEFVVDADKAKAWLAKGAQPSDTVARLFRQAGILPAAK